MRGGRGEDGQGGSVNLTGVDTREVNSCIGFLC